MIQVDVAIIGASLAGAACSRELIRLGVDAVAIERDMFPREKVCGGFLSPGAVRILDEMNVLGEVRRAGAVDITSARVRMGGDELCVPLPQPGLGVSRKTLDAVVAAGCNVVYATAVEVRRRGDGFRVATNNDSIAAKVIVDGAGKLSRFTQRRPAAQFGVQFYADDPKNDALEFWFFKDGYGGAVRVEGGRSNACFLINKDALPRYLSKPGCRVTGPVAYERVPSELIAIGDAAGMIDPFCGEGMRHALDTGRLAAAIVAEGLRRGASYEEMRGRYDAERSRRWSRRRDLTRLVRSALQYPRLAARGFRLGSERIVRFLLGT